MTDTFEELRILAKDGGRLTALDRELLARAADELEYACRELIASQQAVIESQQQRIATTERLIELQKPKAPSYDHTFWAGIKGWSAW